MGDGVLHVVGHHQGGEAAFFHKAVGKRQYLGGGFGIQRRGMLIQQQQPGALHGRHQQGKRLPLPAGKQADLGGKTLLQPQVQFGKKPAELFPVGGGDGPL